MDSFLMYFRLDSPFQRWWVAGLLIVWGCLLFGGFAFGKTNAEGTRRMPTWTRMGSSLVLVIAGWSWCVFVQDSAASGFALLIAIGMTLGCIGDLFLARLFPLPQPTLWGIGAFGLGHVMYIVALLSFANQNGLTTSGQVWGAWIGWLVIGLLGWYFMVFRGQMAGVLHWAALTYALLLASTAGFAWGLALQTSVFVPVAIGAALFLLSDLILAAELFNGLRFPLIGDMIWLTYGPAQAFIVYAVNSALLVVGHR